MIMTQLNSKLNSFVHVSGERKRRVENVLRDLIKRLDCLETIKQIEESFEAENSILERIDLAGGLPGICVLLGELDKEFPEEGWDLKGHELLVQIQKILASTACNSLSLYNGWAGLGFAAYSLSKGKTRYTNFLNQINHLIINHLELMIKDCLLNLENGVRMSDFDVILGLSGIGRYLLLFKEEPEIRIKLEEILDYMVKLSQDKEVNGLIIPNWHIPRDHLFLEDEKNHYPNGNFNLGLAHGIPGPLALLVKAKDEGVSVEGHDDAIRRIVSWLLKWKQEDDYGPIWPFVVSWEELKEGVKAVPRHREAWCYGSPGLSRTLWMAGNSLGEESWKELAKRSFIATCSRPIEQWGIFAPTFCHGYIGLLQILHRMSIDTVEEEFFLCRDSLIDRILDMYNPEFPFGFYDILRDNKIAHDPGLLEGATGSALVLLGLLKNDPSEWDSMFLIS